MESFGLQLSLMTLCALVIGVSLGLLTQMLREWIATLRSLSEKHYQRTPYVMNLDLAMPVDLGFALALRFVVSLGYIVWTVPEDNTVLLYRPYGWHSVGNFIRLCVSSQVDGKSTLTVAMVPTQVLSFGCYIETRSVVSWFRTIVYGLRACIQSEARIGGECGGEIPGAEMG